MFSNSEGLPSIVLVHGAYVDGSGWEGVYRILKKNGFNVAIVQHPTYSLTDDAAVTKLAIDAAENNVILVGHSYGGVVITEAGNHPKVTGLVYIAAFAPDAGESIASYLNQNPAPDAPVPPTLTHKDGFLSLENAKFPEWFAADVEKEKAEFMADSQVLWRIEALNGAVSEPAWKTKPTWYLVAADDKMVPPPTQRSIAEQIGATVAESPGSHSVFISQPETVAALIERAAKGARAATT